MVSKLTANKIYIYLLYLLAFLIPSGFYNFEGIAIALLVIAWVYSEQYKGFFKKITIQNFLLPLFFFLYVISLLYTNNIFNGYKQILMHLSFLLIPIVFISNTIDEKIKEKILYVFLFSTLLFVLIANLYAVIDYFKTGDILVRINLADYNKFTSYGLTRFFYNWHPTYISMFLNFSLVIIFKLFLNKKPLISYFLIPFIALNIVLLNSIIGELCLVILTLFFFLSFFKREIFKIIVMLLFIVFGTIYYVYNPLKIDKLEQFKKTKIELTDKMEKRNILSLRLVSWTSALKIFKEHMVLGVSPGDLKENLVYDYQKNNFEYATLHKLGPHNEYLQVLASFGIFGAVLFTMIFLIPLLKTSNINHIYSWLLLIILIFFFTEDVLERQQGIVFFSYFYSLFVNNNSQQKNVKE